MRLRSIIERLTILILILTLILALSCTAEGSSFPLTEGADIRILSYNILHPDWGRVPVAGRDETVANILRCYRPDVAALQEAGAKWHKALIPLLVESGLYAQACRKSNAEGFTYCTTTFLYNPKAVRLVQEVILDLDYRDATRVLAVAVFEKLFDGRCFVVANTHPAPTNEPKAYARNMADLTAYAKETIEKYADLPVIFCGDFNTPEQSELYGRFMEETGVRDAKYEAETLLYGCSTYIGYPGVIDTERTDQCIDHIFVSERADIKLFTAVIDCDAQSASDHIPICADIELK